MKNIQRIIVPVFVVVFLSTAAFGQSGSIAGGSFSVIDNRITLSGEFANLRSIQATSPLDNLELIDNGGFFPDYDTSPFSNGRVFANSPRTVVVSGSDTVSDISTTGILYNGTPAELETDLQLNVSVGLCGGIALPMGSTIDFTCNKLPPSDIAPGSFFSVEGGRVTLNGNMNISSVHVTSPNDGLSVADGAEAYFDSKAPFSGDASIVANSATTVVIGVLGADKRITIEGPTPTAILYSESLEIARGDLILNLGIGDGPPGVGAGLNGFTLVDGVVTLTADRIEGLAGIEAVSLGGYLSLAEFAAPIPGKSTAPFSALSARIAKESPGEILIESSGSRARRIFGATATGVEYSGTDFDDLVVTVTTVSGEVATLSYVPEPATSSLALLAGLGLLLTRSLHGRQRRN